MTRALQVVREMEVGGDDIGRWLWLAGNRATGMIALDVWDFDGWRDLAARQVQLARETGAVVQLQYALNLLAGNHALAGELTAAARLMDEDRLIADATQNPPLGYSAVIVAAMRGRESEALQTIEGVAREASARGQGRLVGLASHASALLFNGLGRHDAALDAAARVFHSDLLGFGTLVSSELGEAASRTGHAALAGAALEWLTERARATPTDWAVGIENRVRALLSEGDAAERLYRQSIERLGRTRVRVELARSQLLYGEWLRRERRRVDARDQLRAAHDMFSTAGVEAFVERARRELLATGETACARTADTRDDLTPQETQIARLAGDGLSNPEIGARLYISPRTVEWHLHKVFAKLDISSRRQLAGALPEVEPAAVPA